MTDLKHQKSLTNGKGWGQVFVESVKGTTKKITTKAQNVWGGVQATPKIKNIVGGIKATPAIIKKTFKKKD